MTAPRPSFNLSRALDQGLSRLGYTHVPFGRGIATLYCKQRNGVFLTLGVEKSRLYEQRFTASLYVAPALSWGFATPDGFPDKGYRRIGQILTLTERRRIEPRIGRREVDLWWKGFTPENAESFLALVPVVEARIWKDTRLLRAVKTCAAMAELLPMLAAVADEVGKGRRARGPDLGKPPKNKHVPPAWYGAAAAVAKRHYPEMAEPHGIAMLAEESWLVHDFGAALSKSRR
jgi:hypothetical protein